ncbi:hypothetical protein [Agromyces sp. GXQ0307]|uniref:hypothetical protein n=1 Tax=Agromyces sp. GXQ0307 TaxID=3377835 RepID=UPI00383A82A5
MEMIAFGVVSAAALIGLVGILSIFDKKKGTGYYTPYGPDSTQAQRKQINRGAEQFFVGAGLMRKYKDRALGGHEAREQAIKAWEESRSLGEARASTGLGNIAMSSGEDLAARDLWREAASKGDNAAELFIRVTAPSSTSRFSFEEAERAYLLAMTDQGFGEDVLQFAEIARSVSMDSYSEQLILTAQQIRAARVRGPGGG